MNTRDNPADSTLVKFVREGENVASRVRQDLTMRRILGIAFLALAALLFIPSWFLVPGLVFAGFSLLAVKPFWFGSCGSSRRSSSQDSSPREHAPS